MRVSKCLFRRRAADAWPAMQLYAARGVVDYNAFLALLRGQLNQKRLTVVKQAFAKLDPQDSGLVAVEDLKRAFDASAHPVLRNARAQHHRLCCVRRMRRSGTFYLS